MLSGSSYEGKKEPLGTYFIDPVLPNASKIHEGKEMAEVGRILTDIAGGYVADLPSDKDLQNPEAIGWFLSLEKESSIPEKATLAWLLSLWHVYHVGKLGFDLSKLATPPSRLPAS